jgi:hypothetical protein
MKPLRFLFLSTTVTVALLASAQAKDDAARLMLKSEGPADIEVISTSDNSKLIDPQAKGVTLEQVTTPDQWTTATIKFKVSADTDLRLRLAANYTKSEEKWVFIDNVKAEGIQIENPDFENPGPKGPAGWKFLQNGKVPATQIKDEKQAASGESFVKVSHASPIVQMIHVPKDTEVTLTFSAKSATADAPAAN